MHTTPAVAEAVPKGRTPEDYSAVARSSMKPHPSKKRGEDACFIKSGPGYTVCGIADGVGGWASEGIDAGEYARQLMTLASQESQLKELRAQPVQLLDRAHRRMHPMLKGSCTATIAVLEHNVLKYANLGDSGLLIYRAHLDEPLFRTEEQQHRFNCPYQLGYGGGDRATMADHDMIKKSKYPAGPIAVQHNDIVVLGTDGFFDNLFDAQILSEIRDFVGQAEKRALLSFPKGAGGATTTITSAYASGSRTPARGMHTLADAVPPPSLTPRPTDPISDSDSSPPPPAAPTSPSSSSRSIAASLSASVSSFTRAFSTAPSNQQPGQVEQLTMNVAAKLQPSSDASFVAAPSERGSHSLNADQLQALANHLVDAALKVAHNSKARTPFAEHARKHGKRFIGGKLDDITVIVAQIQRQTNTSDVSDATPALNGTGAKQAGAPHLAPAA